MDSSSTTDALALDTRIPNGGLLIINNARGGDADRVPVLLVLVLRPLSFLEVEVLVSVNAGVEESHKGCDASATC